MANWQNPPNIFKNKGDPLLPENYRPITLLSCLVKLFTSVLNNPLTRFLDENDMLSEAQTGFRKDYSTSDNIFSLHCLIELLKAQKHKLFCCFIDFQEHSIQYGGLDYGKNYFHMTLTEKY